MFWRTEDKKSHPQRMAHYGEIDLQIRYKNSQNSHKGREALNP